MEIRQLAVHSKNPPDILQARNPPHTTHHVARRRGGSRRSQGRYSGRSVGTEGQEEGETVEMENGKVKQLSELGPCTCTCISLPPFLKQHSYMYCTSSLPSPTLPLFLPILLPCPSLSPLPPSSFYPKAPPTGPLSDGDSSARSGEFSGNRSLISCLILHTSSHTLSLSL